MTPSRALGRAAAAFAFLFAGQAFADDGSDAGGPALFASAYFTQYNPVTAADMVARVPGFELRDGEERRGFGGSAGNLLINGERPSSKAAASELLKRIPASDVIRIELMSGSSAGSEIRGQGQIVNVVLKPSDSRSRASTTLVAGVRHIQYSNRIGWTVQASRSQALSPRAELNMDVQFPNILGRVVNRETLADAASVETGARYQAAQSQNIGAQASANLRWRPTSADAVNFNIQVVPTLNTTDIVLYDAAASGGLRSLLVGRSDYFANYTSEAGADWEHRLSPATSVKLVTLISQSHVAQKDRFDIFPVNQVPSTRRQNRSALSGERIARLKVKWAPGSGHVLEFGAEGAFNFRDTELEVTSQAQGAAPVRLPVAVANARVEEKRAEAFVSDAWQVSPQLSLEAGLNIEASRISQTGDQAKTRSFKYVKPRVSLTYGLGSRQTLRFSLLRDVAQLDFAEFSTGVDFVNASTIQGNPDLVPESAWKSRLEWDMRLDRRVALTLAGFFDRVDDVHDLVDIGGFDAFGNIGRGSRQGVEVRGSTPLDRLGLANTELRVAGLVQRTRVTDPVTGEKRAFSIPLERQGTAGGAPVLNAGSKAWAYHVSLRQNLPDLQAAWGANLVQWASRTEYRRAETLHYERQLPRLDLFVETTRIRPVTVRLYVNNLLVASETRTRTFYQGSRREGVVDRLERREALGGPEGSRAFGLLVSGRF